MSQSTMRCAFGLLVAASADVCEHDAVSALQVPARVDVKRHQHEVCTPVKPGQKAPIDGLFTAHDGSNVAHSARRGDVAHVAGKFCVDEPTVALLQRAFSVAHVSEFDVLLQKKKTASTEASSTEEAVSRKREPTPVSKSAECAFTNVGSPPLMEEFKSPSDKATYHTYLAGLDMEKLYDDVVGVMKTSESCWPADGPQDDDEASYAGLFGRLAWHCSGTLRVIDGKSEGGCEGGRQRYWPERDWRDNGNLDKARAVLAQIKVMPAYQQLSWGDLMTFAGTVGLVDSGLPSAQFCFGRIDDDNGKESVMLGSEGITDCELSKEECITHAPCQTNFHWPEQDPTDHPRCNLTQADGRQQGSHSVGLIYVYPEGPQLKASSPDYDKTAVHQRSRKLSADEVRDTFKTRMGWTDQETVALIGGGHTLGRGHGNCASNPDPSMPCKGKYTKTAGFEGAWTRTPSKWNYDYFKAMLDEEWVPSKSPDGEDQWKTKSEDSDFAKTMRLTADLAVVTDPTYREWAVKYNEDSDLFNKDFADAWFKLTHRSAGHPGEKDLENDANKCTTFEFVTKSAL